MPGGDHLSKIVPKTTANKPTGSKTDIKRSTDRTQTTHVGSIPRPDSLVDYMIAEDKGEAFDTAAFETALTQAVSDVVGH